jgi:hypothetical protein
MLFGGEIFYISLYSSFYGNKLLFMATMVPGKRARREIGKAGTSAVVEGLRLYGPHALGFFFFAFIAISAAAMVLVLGVPLIIGVPGIALSIALSAVVNMTRNHFRR